VHNTRHFSLYPTQRCPLCGEFLRNSYMTGNCFTMASLRQDRHNIALQILISLLETSDGGRGDVIYSHFGNKTIKQFTPPSRIDCLPEMYATTHNRPIASRMADKAEGLRSFARNTPAIIPPHIIPSEILPRAHKPDFIQLIDPTYNTSPIGGRKLTFVSSIQIGK
jgi:hypothetical protein